MRGIASMIGTLLVAASAGPAVACGPEQAATPQTQPAARRVFLDPATGELAAPTAEQRQAVQQQAQSPSRQSAQRAETLPQVFHREGMTIVTVPRTQWPSHRVRINDRGEVVAAPTAEHD